MSHKASNTSGEAASAAGRNQDLARRYLDLWERQVAALANGSVMPPGFSGPEPAVMAERAANLMNIGAVAMADIVAISTRDFAAAANKGQSNDGANGERRSEPVRTASPQPASGAAEPNVA